MNMPRKRRLPYKPIRKRWPVGEHGPELVAFPKGATVQPLNIDNTKALEVVAALKRFYRQGGVL